MHAIRYTITALLVVACTGCGLTGGSGREDPGPVPPPPNDGEPRGQADESIIVPRSSEIAREGRGGLSYQPDRDGVIYLYDADAERVIDRKSIRGGERYTFDPKRDIATIDGSIVTETEINDRSRHRLYFDPGGRIASAKDTPTSGSERISGDERVTGSERISRPAPEPQQTVPPAAVLIAEGRERLTYRADREGTIYVRDVDKDRVVWSGRILRNERLAVEPRRQRITINDRPVHEQQIQDGNEYRVYFEPR